MGQEKIKNKKSKIKNSDRTQITIVLGVVLKDGKVLMSQRFEKECPDAHLKWELPGGKINFNETPAKALEREILEETGITVRAEKLVPIIRTCIWNYTSGITQHTILIAFKCKFLKQSQVKPKDHHVERFDWIKVNKIKSIETLPGDKDFIKAATKLI